MGSLSDYVCDELLDHVFNGVTYTSPSNMYVALSKADIFDDGTGLDEPAPASYNRKEITFGSASTHRSTQDAVVQFDQALDAAWGAVTHWGIYDAVTGGNLLAHGAFSSTANVDQYKTLSIAIGNIYVEITTDISDYLADNLLDLVFNGTAYAIPTIYVALLKVDIVDTDSGGDLSEFTMTNYTRIAFSDWSTVASGSLSNDSLIDFGVLVGSSELLEAAALVDDGSVNGGNVLFYDNNPSITIDIGDRVRVDVNDYTIDMS